MLHRNPSERYANLIRIIVFGIWLLKFALEPLERLSDLPVALFAPPFPLIAIPSDWHAMLLAPGGLIALRIIGFVACALCLWRRFLPTAGILASIAILIHQCTLRGFGHINHAEIPAMIGVFIYTLFSYTKNQKDNPEPLAITFVICLSYTLIAAHRLAFGGTQIFQSDTITYWAANNSSLVSYFDFKLGLQVAASEWQSAALKIGFVWVTLCELVAPLAITLPRLRLILFVSLLGFHIGAFLTMNILFWENMVLLTALLGPSLFLGKEKGKLDAAGG